MQNGPRRASRRTCGPRPSSKVEDRSDPAVRFLEHLRSDGPAPPPTVAVVVAHPDDEVIGAGAQLPRLGRPFLVHVTDGAPRNLADALAAGFDTRRDYALARRRELERALTLAGIDPDRALEIGVADQEASLHLSDLASNLANRLLRVQPDLVITHPYEGGHPDHDATAFAVHAACRLIERSGVAPPAIVEMTSYHNRDGDIAVFSFLPSDSEVVTLPLDEAQRALKRRMIDCFASQTSTLAPFPVEVERFRAAPAYDFTRPPHGGTLFYELFHWGMTGDRWRALAAGALAALRLAGPL